MKHALIENSIVVALSECDPSFIFSADAATRFIDCPDEVEHGWSFDGVNFTAPPQPPQPPAEVIARENFKRERTAAVEAITVTTKAGNTFDGDEISQTRMARAIMSLQATGIYSVNWVLSNNTVIQASAVELSEALALAGAAQAALWVI